MNRLTRLGVFDSGLGGLTVLNEVCKRNKGLDVVYFGDTARVPYGSRTPEAITRYAQQDMRFLLSCGVDGVLIACGTVSTNCLPVLKRDFSLPIVGVIEAGSRAALAQSAAKRIGIIGTRATIRSGAYEKCIRELCPSAQTVGVACPLFVPLIENGFTAEDPLSVMTAERYLSAFRGTGVDAIIMGCTHFPFLTETFRKILPSVAFINVGVAVAMELTHTFELPTSGRENQVSYYVSDADTGFLDIARRYLDAVTVEQVNQINIDQY